jgi:CxxC motif-containing protein
MTNETTYLCIGCPLGCRLEVEEDAAGDIVEVRGFACKRGKEYAIQEHTAPQRTVATTVAIRNSSWARLPVRSSAPVPKDAVVEICRQLHAVETIAPVQMGQVIVANVLGTGADMIATRDMPLA